MDSETAYRWRCPLSSCNNEQSILYGDKTQVETEFEAHVNKHSIVDAMEFLKTSKWLAAFTLQEA